jgi:hypothetical protein
VKSNVYFQNFCEKNIHDKENQIQMKDHLNLFSSNPQQLQTNKIQSSIFPTSPTNLDKIKEVTSNLFSQNKNIQPNIPFKTFPTVDNSISAFNNQNNRNNNAYSNPVKQEIYISDSESKNSQVTESNGLRASQMTQPTNQNECSKQNSTYLRVFLKRIIDNKSQPVPIFSKKIKLNIPVRMIIQHNSKSQNGEIPESISKLLELYFSDYFYHESGDFTEIGGIVNNSQNLRFFLTRNRSKWNIETVDLYFYDDYTCVLNYFRNASQTSYTFSDLVKLSEDYPECGGLDFVRDFIKVEISTEGNKSQSSFMEVDSEEEDSYYASKVEDINKNIPQK